MQWTGIPNIITETGETLLDHKRRYQYYHKNFSKFKYSGSFQNESKSKKEFITVKNNFRSLKVSVNGKLIKYHRLNLYFVINRPRRSRAGSIEGSSALKVDISVILTHLFHFKVTPLFQSKVTPSFQSKVTPCF